MGGRVREGGRVGEDGKGEDGTCGWVGGLGQERYHSKRGGGGGGGGTSHSLEVDIGERSKFIDCSSNIQQPAAANLYSKSYS